MKTDTTSPPKWTREAKGTLFCADVRIDCSRDGGFPDDRLALRVMECLNALAGIESPEDFVREVREVLQRLERSGPVTGLGDKPYCAECEAELGEEHLEDCAIGRLLSLLNGERKDER